MEEVECQLEHIHEDEEEEERAGGHHCEVSLKQLGWTTSLDLKH